MLLQVSKSIWGLFPEDSNSLSLLVEQAAFRQYEAAAEMIIEQLREALGFSAEELRRHKCFKHRFERYVRVDDKGLLLILTTITIRYKPFPGSKSQESGQFAAFWTPTRRQEAAAGAAFCSSKVKPSYVLEASP